MNDESIIALNNYKTAILLAKDDFSTDRALHNYMNFAKIYSLMAQVNVSKETQDAIKEILAKFSFKPSSAFQDKLQVLATEISFLEKVFTENIQKSHDKIPHDEYTRIIHHEKNRTKRRNVTSEKYTYYNNNVSILTELVFLRNILAKKNGYNNHTEYTLANGTLSNKQSFDELINKSINAFSKDLPQALALFNSVIGDHNSLYEYDTLYALNYLLYNNNAQISVPWEDALMRVIDVSQENLRIIIKHVPIDTIYREIIGTIIGVYQFSVYNSHSAFVGTIVIDSAPRKNKPTTGLTDQLVTMSVHSPENEYPVAFVIISHNDIVNYFDIIRTFHELGHAFEVIFGCKRNVLYRESGFNGIPRDQIEFASQKYEKNAYDPNILSYVANVPIDHATRAVMLMNYYKTIDWMGTVAMAKFDHELHTLCDKNAIREFIENYNEYTYSFTKIKKIDTINAVGGFSHMVDYAAMYYAYLLAEIIE